VRTSARFFLAPPAAYPAKHRTQHPATNCGIAPRCLPFQKDFAMPNLNRVMLMGNLTRDIELKTIGSGQSVARIGIAINRQWTTPDGEKREEVTFVDCEAWGKQAEVMAKFLSKGRPVYIEGRLKLDQWQDKETGANRTAMRVVVEGFQFIDSKGGGGGGGGGGDGASEDRPARSAAPRSSGAPTRAPASKPAAEAMDPDDIPF
jgi:single-strand DNA-binding protein